MKKKLYYILHWHLLVLSHGLGIHGNVIFSTFFNSWPAFQSCDFVFFLYHIMNHIILYHIFMLYHITPYLSSREHVFTSLAAIFRTYFPCITTAWIKAFYMTHAFRCKHVTFFARHVHWYRIEGKCIKSVNFYILHDSSIWGDIRFFWWCLSVTYKLNDQYPKKMPKIHLIYFILFYSLSLSPLLFQYYLQKLNKSCSQ